MTWRFWRGRGAPFLRQLAAREDNEWRNGGAATQGAARRLITLSHSPARRQPQHPTTAEDGCIAGQLGRTEKRRKVGGEEAVTKHFGGFVTDLEIYFHWEV